MGKLSRREIAHTIQERTIQMRGSERVAIRMKATAALRTHAGHDTNWMIFFPQRRLWPFRSKERRQHVIREFEKNPETIYEYMAQRMSDYDSLVGAIKGAFKNDNPYPFTVVRNLYPTRVLRWSSTRRAPDREEWYLRDHVYDFVSSGLIQMTGEAVHRLKEEGEPPWKVYRTTSNEEVNILNEGKDLPLRYRQATPDLMMNGESANLRPQDTAARVVVFACVENPIADPIYLLPTSQVFEALTDEDINALETQSFSVFDHLGSDLKQRHLIHNQRIAFCNRPDGKCSDENRWLSFDLNRMDLETNAINEQREALKNLIAAIKRLDKGASDDNTDANWKKSQAIPIVLRRGDALVIDNYRMLFRRREQKFRQINRPLWWRPVERWLRAYYGFPDPQSDDGSTTSERE